MSTNDTVLLLASGASGVEADPLAFTAALTAVCRDLAQQMQADAEGVTKRITVRVSGAASEDDAVTVARTVARDSLVKTALFGSDPNWGRIAAAVGYADADVDPEPLDITINGVLLCRGGVAAGDRVGSRPVRQGRSWSRSSSASATAPRRSSPPTCRTPTSRRTVPTPPESSTRRRRHRPAAARQKAGVLAEALPWLQRFHGQIVVVKYGGNAMVDERAEAGLRPGHGVPAARRHPPGRGARRRPADHRHARPARPAGGVPRRAAGHHPGDDRRRADGAGRAGRPGAGRADQPARPVRGRACPARTRAVHRGEAHRARSTARRSTSAWSATWWRSTRTRARHRARPGGSRWSPASRRTSTGRSTTSTPTARPPRWPSRSARRSSSCSPTSRACTRTTRTRTR